MFSPETTSSRLKLFDLHPQPSDFLREVQTGLGQTPKRLPSMYFYDERGSKLFDQICELEEYYPTRTEIDILRNNAQEISSEIGTNCMLIELGSGSSLKTRILLRRLRKLHSYVPVDISKDHLLSSAEAITRTFPHLSVLPVCADFMRAFRLPPVTSPPLSKVVFFPGSTIGNFGPEQRSRLFRQIRELCMPEGGGLLIGIDLKKDRQRLERAYNDAAGVTAEFNLNLLRRINRELKADFDLDQFEHQAVYNPTQGRIEMHLVSQADQQVAVGSERFEVGKGERICTEHSHKFAPGEFIAAAEQCGLQRAKVWTDEEQLFAVILLRT